MVFALTRSRRAELNAGSRRRRRGGEQGSVTVFVVLFALALVAAAGLVIDGGYTMAAKRQATGRAEQAARIGSDALNQASLRNGITSVDRSRAIGVAQAYLRRVGAHGTVRVNGGAVIVRVTDHQHMAILSAVGIDQLTVHGQASSRSIDEDTPN